jgi:hypothetical protein
MTGEVGAVSIIVPTFNRSAMVVELIDSILVQTWRPIEIIVVDDGSTDDTAERVGNYVRASGCCRIVLLRQDNAGPASARNLGLQHARGEFIQFVDSDDLLLPHAVECLVKALQISGRPYCLAEMSNADAAGKPLGGDRDGLPRQIHGRFMDSRWMTHGALYRRTAITASGAFNEDLRVGEDSEFQWRMMAVNGRAHILPERLGVRRLHSQGHLSIGLSADEKARSVLRAILAFQAWAGREGRSEQIDDRSFPGALLVSGARLASAADWASRDLAFDAIDRMRSAGPGVRAIVATLRLLPTRAGCRGLWFAGSVAGRLRAIAWDQMAILTGPRAREARVSLTMSGGARPLRVPRHRW